MLEVGASRKPEDLTRAYSMVAGTASGLANPYGLTMKDFYADLHGGDKRRNAWQEMIDAAERYNQPGVFTALIGWEWSSQPGGANLPPRGVHAAGRRGRAPVPPLQLPGEWRPGGPVALARGDQQAHGRGLRRHPRTTRTSATGACSRSRVPTAARSTRRTPAPVSSGSRWWRSRRSRATPRRIPACRRPTSSRTTRPTASS